MDHLKCQRDEFWRGLHRKGMRDLPMNKFKKLLTPAEVNEALALMGLTSDNPTATKPEDQATHLK